MAPPRRPYIPIRPQMQITLSGQDRDPKAQRVLSMKDVLSLQTTNVVTPGSAKASFAFAHKPGDNWLWDFRAMDTLSVAAAITGPGGKPSFYPIWTGLLDNPQDDFSPDSGEVYPVDASTFYKKLETNTEGDFQSGYTDWSTKLVSQGSLPAWQVVTWAAQACGMTFAPGSPDTTGPDIRSVPTPIIGTDPSTYPGVNHQYMNWSNIVANAAQFVGRELFTDERGNLNYRVSHYENDPIGQIRKEWIIHPTVSIDTDMNLANEVRVRWGFQEQSGVGEINAGVANAPPGYPMSHYGLRQITVAAPWIFQLGDANWYAGWILSWFMHNTRPGIVQLAFAPDIVCGEVYILPWPQPTAYYVMSVVHNYRAGQAPTTTLGLSYGRPLGTKWYDIPAPANFGASILSSTSPQGSNGSLVGTTGAVTGSNWRISYYTPSGLADYSDADGEYLTGAYGYKLYQTFYERGATDPVHRSYARVRECAIAGPYTKNQHGDVVGPYVIPELSGQGQLSVPLAGPDPNTGTPDLTKQVHLSKGDMLMLQPSGLLVEVGDTIGTLTADAPNGRELDLFFWDASQVPDMPEFQDVIYLYVKEAGMVPPPYYDIPDQPIPGSGPVGAWTYGGAVASFAVSTMAQLGLDANGANRVANGGSPLGRFCKSQGSYWPPQNPPNPQEAQADPSIAGDCECVLFVRWCYAMGAGQNKASLPGISRANLADQPGGWVGNGMANVTGQLPQYGDVLVFNDIGQNIQNPGDFGHVAIVVGVTPPSGNQAGSVQLAQSNCLSGANGLPLTSSLPLVNDGGAFYVRDQSPNYFGLNVRSLLRWNGGQ